MTWADAAHLLRRTGFGATGAEVDAVVGRSAADVVAEIVAADPNADPGVKLAPLPKIEIQPDAFGTGASRDKIHAYVNTIRKQQHDMVNWWLSRMIAVQQPFGERLTLAWHGIFATGTYKVQAPNYMVRQNERFRTLGRGDFRELALTMLTDAAMLWWLDGGSNTKAAPNENLAREFMELFTLGVNGGYTEQDVREGARALTGWKIDHETGLTALDAALHDDGSKTFLGVTGNIDSTQYCDIVLARSQSAPFVLNRLWMQLVSDQPAPAATLAAMQRSYGKNRNLAAAFTTMYTDPGFAAARGTKVAGPVEWGIGLARAVGVRPDDTAAINELSGNLTALGQQVFYPPSVGGWPLGQAWLSTASAQARMNYAETIVALGNVEAVSKASAATRLDAVAHLLGVPTWSNRTLAALKPVVSNPTTLVAYAANTPEYVSV